MVPLPVKQCVEHHMQDRMHECDENIRKPRERNHNQREGWRVLVKLYPFQWQGRIKIIPLHQILCGFEINSQIIREKIGYHGELDEQAKQGKNANGDQNNPGSF
jgi:hypothetical protein